MLEKTLGLMFFLKKPQDYVEGLVPIYLRITVDGVRKEMSTKRFWEPEKWNAKANRATGTREEVKTLNTYLDVLQNQIYDARTHLIEPAHAPNRLVQSSHRFPLEKYLPRRFLILKHPVPLSGSSAAAMVSRADQCRQLFYTMPAQILDKKNENPLSSWATYDRI